MNLNSSCGCTRIKSLAPRFLQADAAQTTAREGLGSPRCRLHRTATAPRRTESRRTESRIRISDPNQRPGATDLSERFGTSRWRSRFDHDWSRPARHVRSTARASEDGLIAVAPLGPDRATGPDPGMSAPTPSFLFPFPQKQVGKEVRRSCEECTRPRVCTRGPAQRRQHTSPGFTHQKVAGIGTATGTFFPAGSRRLLSQAADPERAARHPPAPRFGTPNTDALADRQAALGRRNNRRFGAHSRRQALAFADRKPVADQRLFPIIKIRKSGSTGGAGTKRQPFVANPPGSRFPPATGLLQRGNTGIRDQAGHWIQRMHMTRQAKPSGRLKRATPDATGFPCPPDGIPVWRNSRSPASQ